MHTGTIIDFYDDPNGLVLKTKIGAEQVPGFIKTAQYLGEQQRESLPDDVFALVMLDRGEKLRKYACVDKGNTSLSVIYFLENKDKLPEEAQKVAAANLLTACDWHDLRPPALLMKTAGVLGAALNAATLKGNVSSGIQRHKKLMGARPMMPKVGDLTGSNIMPLSSDTEKTAWSRHNPLTDPSPETIAARKYGIKRFFGTLSAEDKAKKPPLFDRYAFKKKEKTAGDAELQTRYSKLVEKKYGMPEGQAYSTINPPDSELDKLWLQAGGKRKTAGILQPDLPRARDVIKGRGPAKRAERSALRDKLRSTHPAGKPRLGDELGDPEINLSGKSTGSLLQPGNPRARDVIKGRGPTARALRTAFRDKSRSTHPEGQPYLGDKRKAGITAAQKAHSDKLHADLAKGTGVTKYQLEQLAAAQKKRGPAGIHDDWSGFTADKTASVMDPYVDITGKSAPQRFEKVAHQRFALVKEGQSRFPIDTYGDVLEADRWFNDHGESLHPSDRREMCTKLAARADEIGCKVTDYVRKYAGAGYAPDGEVRVAVSTRMQYFQDDSPERDMLHGLMNKYAHVPPDVFCEAVKQFDEATGLDYRWDDGVYDPWYTTYGFIKEAEWEFSTHGDKINEEQLKQVVNASYPLIEEKLGEDVANGLKKSPVQIFDSLPLDTKRIIMRMANDPQPSPALVLS
jgi:hypothetical protein